MHKTPITPNYTESKKPKMDRFTVTKYENLDNRGISTKSSLSESIPNKITRVLDPTDRTIGEMPPIEFKTMQYYRDSTPQLDSVAEYLIDLIVGTDMNINCDDEQAKQILEDFSNNTQLFDKVRSVLDSSLVTGYGQLVRVRGNGKQLINVEEEDITNLKRVHRDDYGNVLYYVFDYGGTEEKKDDIDDRIPIVLRKRGREHFGRSFFHSLAVYRQVGNRTTRPLVEALWSLDDVVVGTLENFAFPIEWHHFENANQEELEAEARKYRERKPGDVFFVTRTHEIDRREPTQARFDSFFEHTSKIMQLGTGFPLEILLGDFTSRASSETTDSLLMRRVKAYQKYITKIIKSEILEFVLMFHPSGKWKTREAVNKANITIEFEVQSPTEYTPDQVLARVNSGMWTKTEGREYDKENGMDLFDDDIIAADQERADQEKDLDLELKKNPPTKEPGFNSEKVTEKIVDEFTQKIQTDIEKIKETIEEKKFNRKAKTEILTLLESLKQAEKEQES